MTLSTRRAMTLMEILLVAVLVSVIGLAVFQAFNNGVKLWARSKALNQEIEAVMFLDRMGEDLRSTVNVTGIPFKGIGSQIAFPAIVLTPADKNSARSNEGLVDQIGAIQYSYDPGEKKIYRRQANYAQALKGQWSPLRSIVSGVEDFLLRYYFLSDKGMHVKSLVDAGVPCGVMVEIVYKDGMGEHRLRQFMLIPVGRQAGSGGGG